MTSSSRLLALIDIQSDIAGRGADLGGLMETVVRRILDLVGADGAAIGLREGAFIVYRAASGIAAPLMGVRLRCSSCELEHVRAEPCCLVQGGDVSEWTKCVSREEYRLAGVRSMVVVPLRFSETAVGILQVMSNRSGRFSKDNIRLLELLSVALSAAMFHASKNNANELFRRATHDVMTDLANRALFGDRLKLACAQNRRTGSLSGLLMIDMDGLKTINDALGHRVGDAAIIEFAHRLLGCARASDTVARIGGDEFAIILSPMDPFDGAQKAIGRVESALARPFVFEDHVLSLQASIGYALIPDDGYEFERVTDVADRRMYEMKRGHKGTSGVKTE